jgi:hypothetical protein
MIESCARYRPFIINILGEVQILIQQPGREVDHSPPTTAEVKNKWIYTSTPPYVFMA